MMVEWSIANQGTGELLTTNALCACEAAIPFPELFKITVTISS